MSKDLSELMKFLLEGPQPSHSTVSPLEVLAIAIVGCAFIVGLLTVAVSVFSRGISPSASRHDDEHDDA